jgi:hypothetical protein
MQITREERLALNVYAHLTPSAVLPDEDLHAWADYYQREPALRCEIFFDQFAQSPREWCLRVGLLPRPHDGAPPRGDEEYRRLLPAQRLAAGKAGREDVLSWLRRKSDNP